VGTPVPKVYARCFRAQDSTIGAECIFMEKLSGVRLGINWAGVKVEDRFTLRPTTARPKPSR